MKPITNFRDHPALKYDEQKSIFTIKYSTRSEIYLYTEKEVKRIIPVAITDTNIGEPYQELARFVFLNEDEVDSIDIDPDDLQDLGNMLHSIDSLLPIPDKFTRYLDSYDDE
jgi:hypothetical protein